MKLICHWEDQCSDVEFEINKKKKKKKKKEKK